jgi:hypothetical protein
VTIEVIYLVKRNTAQPGIKLAITTEFVQRAQGSQEYFVNQILGYGLVSVYLFQYQRVESVSVEIIEFRHSCTVTRPQLLGQLGFTISRRGTSYCHVASIYHVVFPWCFENIS